jgi:NitT/TauT family transport system substrate-binding protein
MRKMVLFFVGLLIFTSINENGNSGEVTIGMAVEFTDHAACAYISRDKGWFKEEGLKVAAYESYVTGMALAAALARGDIQVAFICLVPAINAYANARVPIKIVAGTHKYGFGLVVNPNKVKTVNDLEKPDIRIGCVQVGAASDAFMRKTIDKYHLDRSIFNKVQRMNPPQQLLAMKMGKLDAAFLPEHWATMAEESGFKMLKMGQNIWPEMQGSVLLVKDGLIKDNPEIVRKLVKVSRKATDWTNKYPEEAARIMVRQLQLTGERVFPIEVANVASKLEITPKVLLSSMNRLEYSIDIDSNEVQKTIDYVVKQDYIKNSFRAENILDLRFLK